MASGQIVSFGFIAWGVFQIVQGNVANGIWIAFIGWFLQNATAAENASRTVQRQLSGTTVAQAMGLVDEPRVPSRMKLRQLVDEHVLAHGQGSFLVVDGDVPRGVLTLPDVTRVPQDRWDWTSVSEVMTPWARLGRVAPTTDLLDALKLMESNGFGHLPVVEGDRLVGLLTRDEILRFLRLRAEVGPAA
jgi:CBS domain-containing protein